MPPDATTSLGGILDPQAARRHFRLTRYAPADDLAALVERHWIVEWDLDEPFTQELVTHPCVNLVFERDVALVHGVVTGRGARRIDGRGKAVGVKFRPGGLHPFLPMPAWRLTDSALAVDEAFGVNPHAEVLAAKSDRAQIAVVERFLRSLPREPDPLVTEVVAIFRLILRDPSLVRVEQLAARAGRSPRSLQRLFREYVGVTPKWVLQRLRLQEAADRMLDGGGDWAALALDLGYFDQAHFINDFRRVVGRSPGEYAALAAAA
jgi:AraC-like DNA-binding protein